jgi:hypothetical protein
MWAQVRVSTTGFCGEVPTTTQQPFTRLKRFGPRTHGLVHILEFPQAAQVQHGRAQMPDLPHVNVRIVETGQQCTTLEIDFLRARIGQVLEIRKFADRENFSISSQQRLGWDLARDRVDGAVVEEQIGHVVVPSVPFVFLARANMEFAPANFA